MTQGRQDLLGRALAVLLCLPAVVLVLPFGPLAGDAFVTELSGTAWTALLLLPAAALAVFSPRGRATGLFLLLAYWLWSAFSATRGDRTDSLETDRALMLLAACGVATIAGAGLNTAGRRALAATVMLLSLVASLATLHLRYDNGDWAVPIGNSGETELALLPGAIVGGWYALRGDGWWRITGGLTLALAFVILAAAPSIAALGALAAGLACGLFMGTRRRALFALATGFVLAGFVWVAFLRPTGVPGAPSTAQQSVGSASGLSVRAMVVPPALGLVASDPVFGVGPGQFAARFAEVRDPEEIERSTHGRKLSNETEVEHPHSDLLLALVESGVLGGLAFAAFLAVAAWAALRSLLASAQRNAASTDDERAPLAAAVLGVLIVGSVWYPLTYLAASAVPAFAMIGALIGGPPADATSRTRRSLPLAAAVLLALFVPRAKAIADHGRALAQLTPDSTEADWDRRLGAAQSACPDSVTALSLRASFLRQGGRPDSVQRDVWLRALALRPFRFESLMSLGNVELRLGNPLAAREWFARARAVDPYHPTLLRNIARLEYNLDDLDAATSALDDLAAKDRLDPLWLLGLGTELLLDGRLRAGQHALARADSRFTNLTGETCKALELEYRQQGHQQVGEAFETLGHTLWAREQAQAGDFDTCRRSLRQALRSPRLYHPPEGPIRLRMELAAALYRSNQPHEAREIMESISPTPRDWLELPDWAGETLLEQGWMATAAR
ncbi:MAG: O-antigen ligase family protein [Planctomycetes bacterium]|nr:O-antigen ligase family protein [Planctomycetota bacterium]